MEPEPPTVLLDLPPDLVLHLARGFLDAESAARLAATCRALSLLDASDLFWSEQIARRWGRAALAGREPPSPVGRPRAARSAGLPGDAKRRFGSGSGRAAAPASPGARRSVPLNFEDDSEIEGDAAGQAEAAEALGDLPSPAIAPPSPFKALYGRLHVAEARREAMWADGSFRTRTIHVLDDYVRRLLPLPSMPQMILLGTYAGPLHLINAISGEIEVTYEGQPTETTCLDCDGDVVAAGCSGSVRVWDAWTGEELAVVAGHSRGVVGVKIMDLAGSDLEGWDAAVSFDAGDSGVVASRMALVTRAARTKVVYSAGLDGVVLAHRITLPPRPPHGAATPSPPCYDPDRDTKRLDLPTLNGRLTSFLCSADLLVLGTSNGSIHVIRVPLASFPPLPPSAPETAIQGAHGGPVRSLRRDPARGILASGGDDCRLRLWSLALPAGPAAPSIDPVRSFRAHNHGTVMSIDLDLARGRLSTGGTDGAVKVWLVGDDLMRDDGWIIWRHTAYLGSVHVGPDFLLSDGFNNVLCIHSFAT